MNSFIRISKNVCSEFVGQVVNVFQRGRVVSRYEQLELSLDLGDDKEWQS